MHPSARPVYYGVVFAWYMFFFYGNAYSLANLDKSRIPTGPFNPFYGSKWKYLSFLNVVLQAFFYAISLLTSAFILMKKRRIATTMISFKDLIFSSLVFPLSTFVFATFWSMYLYDRNLIYPKYMDSIIPEWINHGMHTLVFLLALVEMFVIPHQYPSVGKSLSILGVLILAYLLWILYFFAKTGKWLYPIFKFLSPLGMIVFSGIAAVTIFFYYILGRFLNRMIWGDTVPVRDVHKKKCK
ncbi:androgen-dependent TFPI-regulating protein [Pantherophis guttatus]|uniref:Androgen-dependent TFPI-regulating protein n=1 Tax=Pantherophis guttatus TaxID=94885 RepID=A0A6P9CQ09_PANGU|nr:androgen-dependent TFPI-regulating protein [Pantherophis guttatus]